MRLEGDEDKVLAHSAFGNHTDAGTGLDVLQNGPDKAGRVRYARFETCRRACAADRIM